MDEQKRNLLEIFFGMQDYFSPKIIGEVNDVFVKLAKVKGEDVPGVPPKNYGPKSNRWLGDGS
jgi:hypothetical protein